MTLETMDRAKHTTLWSFEKVIPNHFAKYFVIFHLDGLSPLSKLSCIFTNRIYPLAFCCCLSKPLRCFCFSSLSLFLNTLGQSQKLSYLPRLLIMATRKLQSSKTLNSFFIKKHLFLISLFHFSFR